MQQPERNQNIYTETDKAWIDAATDWEWINEGKEFIWVSEKDGWRHAYRISKDGKKQTLITKGDYDVIESSLVDEKNNYVVFYGIAYKCYSEIPV